MGTKTIFVYLSCVVLAVIAYKIPKKMKLYEMYVTSLFAICFGFLVDMILAVKRKLYVLDKPGVQIPPIIGQLILYSTASIILLNLYAYNKPIKWKVMFILIFSVLTLIFEIISNKFRFFKYNEWNIWYSALCYPFLICFLLLYYMFFMKLVKRAN